MRAALLRRRGGWYVVENALAWIRDVARNGNTAGEAGPVPDDSTGGASLVLVVARWACWLRSAVASDGVDR